MKLNKLLFYSNSIRDRFVSPDFMQESNWTAGNSTMVYHLITNSPFLF